LTNQITGKKKTKTINARPNRKTRKFALEEKQDEINRGRLGAEDEELKNKNISRRIKTGPGKEIKDK
jgi:hypothetical protein